MAPFLYEITIPKSTPATAPVKVTLQIPLKRIRRMILTWPNGTKGNVGVRITNRGLPLVPPPDSNVSFIRGDTTVTILKFRSVATDGGPALKKDKDGAAPLESDSQLECYGFNADGANDWYVNLQLE